MGNEVNRDRAQGEELRGQQEQGTGGGTEGTTGGMGATGTRHRDRK